jgi:hypothetical protein
MNTVIKIVSVIVLLGGALQQTALTSDNCAKAATCFTGVVSPECDEEPIIVRGHVRTVNGSPINAASVKLKQGGVVKYQTTTTSSGEYCMGGVTSGTYVLQLSASGYVTKNIDLSISSEVVRIDTLIAE